MARKLTKPERAIAERVTHKVFALSDDIRYVAVFRNGKLESISKPDLEGGSSWDSDKYEEIIVNPTLVTLLQQRGSIDCGGVQYIMVRYGNFTQLVYPIRCGHISIAFEPGRDFRGMLPGIVGILKKEMLLTAERE